MVRPDGTVFHIDFGWCFGQDPQGLLSAEMKLPQEFLEPLGDDSQFQRLIALIFCVLRPHVLHILTLSKQLWNEPRDWRRLSALFEHRFALVEPTGEKAAEAFLKVYRDTFNLTNQAFIQWEDRKRILSGGIRDAVGQAPRLLGSGLQFVGNVGGAVAGAAIERILKPTITPEPPSSPPP